MSFALVKPGGFAFGERLPSAAMNALDADHANAIDGVAGGTYTPSAPIIIGGSGLQIGTLSVTGNSTIGNATGDTLTVEATATINGPWTFASGSAPIFNDGPTFNNTATFNAGVILGSAAADAITVNGTLTVNNDATIGSSSGDVLTINASTVFNGPISFEDDLVVTGAVELQNDVTLGTNASDLIDVLGRFRLGRVMEFQNAGTGIGRVPFRAMTLPDSDDTLSVGDGNIFRIPNNVTGNRTYTLSGTDAVDGDFMVIYMASNFSLDFDVVVTGSLVGGARTYVGGVDSVFLLIFRSAGQWVPAFAFNNA